MEHAQDEMEQTRQAPGLKKQSCTLVIRDLYHFVVEPIPFCLCSFCVQRINADMNKQNNFFNKTLPLLLSKLTSFVASSDYWESAFALIVHIV